MIISGKIGINSVNGYLTLEVKFSRLLNVNDVKNNLVVKTLAIIDGRAWKEIVLKKIKYSRHNL